jgi:colanic acid/amylovoran biosynthesis glycosyltransferase
MKAIYIAAADVWRDGPRYVFDRKFYDGMQLYAALWPGHLHCVAWEAIGPRPDFGLVTKAVSELPFGISVLKNGSPLSLKGIERPSLIIACPEDQRQFPVSDLSESTPYIVDIEHTLRMRRDMVAQETRNPIRRFLRLRRLDAVDKKKREVIRNASGMASNGLAAFHEYERDAKASICFFDTRATREMQISAAALAHKQRTILEGESIRLVFSGRLIGIKGIDALLKTAHLLTQQGTPFTLDIYGSGEMEREVNYAAQNCSAIKLHGAVGFETVLMPKLKTEADLFVCCHRQGDPSCTYLETFAAGVPMVGFANESLAPLSVISKAALTVPMNEIRGLADLITRLHHDRQRIVAMSQAAADFSRAHAFEDEFKRRVDFWKQLAVA